MKIKVRHHIDKDFLPKYHGDRLKIVVGIHPTHERAAIHLGPPSFEHSELRRMISKANSIPAHLEESPTVEGFVCPNGSNASREPHVGLRIHLEEGKALKMKDHLTPEQWMTVLEAVKKAGYGGLQVYMFYGDGMEDARKVGTTDKLLQEDNTTVKSKISEATENVLKHLEEQAAQVEAWHKKKLKLKEIIKLEPQFALTSEDKKAIGFTEVPLQFRQELEHTISNEAEKFRVNIEHKHAAEKRREREFLLKEAVLKAMGNFHAALDPATEQGLRLTLAEIKAKPLPPQLEADAVPEIEKNLQLIFEIRRNARERGVNPDTAYADVTKHKEYGENHAERVENHFKLWKVFKQMLHHVDKVKDLTA